MKRTVQILTLVSIFSLFLFGSSAFAQGGKSVFEQKYPEGIVGMNSHPTGEFPAASSPGYHPRSWDTVEASGLIGQTVYSPLQGDLGQVEDLMIDRANGRIALVILSGVPGFAAGYVAVPFSAIERTGEDTYQLNFGDRKVAIPWGDYHFRDPYADSLYEWRSIVGLSTIPPTIDPLWADSVYQYFGLTPYWTEGKTPHPDIMSYRTDRPSVLQSPFVRNTAPDLVGANVALMDGKGAARINDLVVDSNDGRIAFLVLDRVPGRAGQVAVPFSELSMSGNVLTLNTTGEKLAAAPSFDRLADMKNLRYAENVYKYFGQHPYWTEKGIQ
jgi:sporulation protein YlmC with PRC-barrel domain